MRFDLLARPFYTSLSAAVVSLLEEGGGGGPSSRVDATAVDEVVYVGGTASLPGLDEHLMVACGFKEEVEDAFKRGDVVGGGVGDPTTVLSRGCAYQALLVNELVQGEEKDLLKAFEEGQGNGVSKEVSVTSRTVALVFPSGAGTGAGNGTANADKSLVDELTKSAGGTYIPLILKETPLPARRVLDLALVIPADHGSKVVMEVWEVEEDIKIEKRKPLKDIDEDEEEEEEVKHDIVNKMSLLGVLEVAVKGKRGGGAVSVNVSAVRSVEGGLVVEASQAGNGKAVLQI